ncbi:hypothetical protein PoB_000445300 [Plakobranchus ocellatus]|uniref:Tyrosine-protein phosphatase domain-containing protein n=1 Tax=Plakobranchus ocellatus TaxID=259542 RepID=A0AAV3Y6X6_9GAST|nr:hypothetical protein PoB_000445300 [Plakobranchus ocellatus]
MTTLHDSRTGLKWQQLLVTSVSGPGPEIAQPATYLFQQSRPGSVPSAMKINTRFNQVDCDFQAIARQKSNIVIKTDHYRKVNYDFWPG